MSLPPFQHLVDEHWRDVARLAHALAPGHGDDVAQQAWTQALAAYPRLTHARSLRSWLLTITHRCAMDHHRAARRTTPHDDPASLDEAPVVVPPDAPDSTLWARVAALPERQREAVVLRFVADLDHRAVAAALGTTPGMSRRLVSDAVATLRLDLDVERPPRPHRSTKDPS
ncbi:RNA polymerase sigma factor [Oryzobacter terrae]|uniref:RNA polymerase sigma factor n=1 Tax=Oryzobacter terrae TaxID=1620385 RepID=UPI003670ADD7